MKGQTGDKVKATRTIASGSVHGLIKIPKGTVLTVTERNSSDDGIKTLEHFQYNGIMGKGSMPYNLFDGDYEVITHLEQPTNNQSAIPMEEAKSEKMDDSLLSLMKKIQEAVGGIRPFNAHEASENAELKAQANSLLLLAIDKLETKQLADKNTEGDAIRREALKEEYNYWLKTQNMFESTERTRLRSEEENTAYNFAVGFVSAVNKSGIFKS